MKWEASQAAPLFAWVGSIAGHDLRRLSGSALNIEVIVSEKTCFTDSGAWSASSEILSIGR